MRNPLIAVAAFGIIVSPVAAQKTSKENQVRDRGQTPTEDDTQTLDRGRLGRQDALPPKPLMLRGTLVDASCLDRSTTNLAQRPEAPVLAPAEKESNNDGVSSHGVKVDAKTAEAERSDVLEHQVPDLRSRTNDPTCAITGNTRGFAMLLDSGRLLNLDEGGNTLVLEHIQTSPAGRAMLSGTAPAFKPKASIQGVIRGDRVMVSKILKMQ